MPHPASKILLVLNEIAKEKQTGPIACHWCNNQVNIVKYGTYKRYDFSGQNQIKVQRYLCKHDRCRRTFSILPHPFLRITRLTLCMITTLIQLVDRQRSTAEVCRTLGLTRSMVDGAIKRGKVFSTVGSKIWPAFLTWFEKRQFLRFDFYVLTGFEIFLNGNSRVGIPIRINLADEELCQGIRQVGGVFQRLAQTTHVRLVEGKHRQQNIVQTVQAHLLA